VQRVDHVGEGDQALARERWERGRRVVEFEVHSGRLCLGLMGGCRVPILGRRGMTSTSIFCRSFERSTGKLRAIRSRSASTRLVSFAGKDQYAGLSTRIC
jgi:hypothetical protein